jgi:fermentation-respiration switch protein FrsA (DUF1100 family)
MDDRHITARRGFQEHVFDILLNEPDSTAARKKLDQLLNSIQPPIPAQEKKASLDRFLSPWFRFNLAYNPASVLQEIKCPVLAVFGEKDLQVPPEGNADAIKAALLSGQNPDFSVVVLPDLNHFFQINKESIPFNYGRIEETLSPEVLGLISDWILKHKGEGKYGKSIPY